MFGGDSEISFHDTWPIALPSSPLQLLITLFHIFTALSTPLLLNMNGLSLSLSLCLFLSLSLIHNKLETLFLSYALIPFLPSSLCTFSKSMKITYS